MTNEEEQKLDEVIASVEMSEAGIQAMAQKITFLEGYLAIKPLLVLVSSRWFLPAKWRKGIKTLITIADLYFSIGNSYPA